MTVKETGGPIMPRPAERIPNQHLKDLIKEAGISHKALAWRMREFSKRGGGTPVGTQHGAIAKYCDGRIKQPEYRTGDVLRAVLSELVGRRLSFEDLGYSYSSTVENIDVIKYPENPVGSVEALDSLVRSAQNGSQLIVIPQAWADLLVNAIFGSDMFADLCTSGNVTEVEVQAVRDAVEMFSSFDYRYGGGQSKSLVAKFLETSVLPCIKNVNPGTEIGRQYFQAAATLARLAGWTAYDMGEHGLAQRYLFHGFRLAKAANDRPLCGRLLAGMSHQANFLGHFDYATHLARAAVHVASGYATPTTMALFHGMEARALASLGNESGVTEALGKAEQYMSRRNPDEDPKWIRYFDEAELHAEYAHSFRDLGRSELAINYAASSIAEADSLYVRSVQFVRTVYATAQLQERELDEAVSLAQSVVDVVAHLHSHRLICYLTDFRRRLHRTAAGAKPTVSFDEYAYNALKSKGFPAPGAAIS
ncbi:hypothetical protein [Nocardia transvalensis]|uniref:hypothetical protein n=1 Tax=Nocardia transvalensis TaxID=37333 RepID=UPI00189563FA|nr:hypothetical protein [Nocardia transvalensis]MBF6329777.1 hypothetical protein [Nocardia transvalensis]